MVPEAVWTAGAERDLLEIYLQLFDAFDGDADLISRVLRQPLQSALGLIVQHPEAWARVKHTKGFRRWLLGPQRRYGLFYVVESRGIVIHGILDMRQNPETIWKRLRGH